MKAALFQRDDEMVDDVQRVFPAGQAFFAFTQQARHVPFGPAMVEVPQRSCAAVQGKGPALCHRYALRKIARFPERERFTGGGAMDRFTASM